MTGSRRTDLHVATTLVLALAGAPSGSASQETDQAALDRTSCVVCHEALGGSLGEPVASFRDDVHAARGFGCTACHGGDPTLEGLDAMAPERGFLAKPTHRDVPSVCGRCHSDPEYMRNYNPAIRVDQVARYATSVHGIRLEQFDDPKVATCISCHPAHAIRPADDPLSSVYPTNVESTCGRCHADAAYMEEYGIPVDQVEDYRTSVHGRLIHDQDDLSAPTCNDCHGNHGAAPPGVSWVGSVCGQCHAVIDEQFEQSLHAQLFPLLGNPGCATCHQNHAIAEAGDEMLGLEDGAVCRQCHSAETASGEKVVAMKSLLASLLFDYDTATALLHRAERAGIEVSQAQFELQDARNALVGARTTMHSFNVEAMEAAVAEGLEVTATGKERGMEALKELRFRRAGLAVSVLIILVLIVGLVLKIRELEARA